MNQIRRINSRMLTLRVGGLMMTLLSLIMAPMVHASTTLYTVESTVSDHNAFKWLGSTRAEGGDTVDVRVKYRNTDNTEQKKVKAFAILPAQLQYVSGSAKLYNNQNPNGQQMSGDITTGGIPLGAHAPGGQSFLTYSAKVAINGDLECGSHARTITSKVTVGAMTRSDTVSIQIKRVCHTAASTQTESEPSVPSQPISTVSNVVKPSAIPTTAGYQHTPAENPTPVTTQPAAAPSAPVQVASSEKNAKLPSTGPDSMIGALLGSGTLAYSTAVYLRSRRALFSAMR